jgi:hypothetical protein
MFKSPEMLLSGVTAPQTTLTMGDATYKLNDLRRTEVLIDVEVASGSPVFSLQPQQSLDGKTWHAVGSAIVAPGLTVITVQAPYFNLNLTAISGGAINVTVG